LTPRHAHRLSFTTTGYNVYDRRFDDRQLAARTGYRLRPAGADTLGGGVRVSIDMMHNGRAVIGGWAEHFRSNSTERLLENFIYYQGSEFNCTYDPRTNLT